jgi:putative transposase
LWPWALTGGGLSWFFGIGSIRRITTTIMEKFKNKYRIPSARASWWDYANAGAYFVTICTADRVHFFGEIVAAPMATATVETRLIASLRPTPMGEWAERIWHEIPNQFAFIQLGAFVVMPNHVHGVLIIEPNPADDDDRDERDVETRLIASLPPQQTQTGGFSGNKNPMLHDNISRVVRWYKGRCTFEMRKIHADFAWQSRFHDHIVRNDGEYERISHYILNNPAQWEADRFFHHS